jgi:hypothetical protein
LENKRWKEQFEDMYPSDPLSCPFPVVLGNHDYDDEPMVKQEAELAYAKANPGTRWHLPARWYRMEWPAKDPVLTILALDSNRKGRTPVTPEEFKGQTAWLAEELKKDRTTPYVMVIAHHPLYSNGQHGDSESLIAEWDDLFVEHKVDVYLCGHDHDMQHLEFENHPTSFVISGGGGARIRELKTDPAKRGPYGKTIYGFSHIQANRERLVLRHIDANRNLLHAFERRPGEKAKVLS